MREDNEKTMESIIKKKNEFIKKEDSYFNWSKSGNGKKSVKRTVPLTLWENQNGLRKDIKAWFLMSKIAVIVNYKRFCIFLQYFTKTQISNNF